MSKYPDEEDVRVVGKVEVKKMKAMQDVGAIYGIPELHEMRLADFSELDKRTWQLIKTVPKVSSPWHYACALLNVFLPGVGTIIASLFAKPCSKSQAWIGLCQLLMSTFIIGWIWSVIWGLMIISASSEEDDIISLLNNFQAQSDTKGDYYGAKIGSDDPNTANVQNARSEYNQANNNEGNQAYLNSNDPYGNGEQKGIPAATPGPGENGQAKSDYPGWGGGGVMI